MDMYKIHDTNLLKRRSSLFKPTVQEDEALKNLVYEFVQLQKEKDLLSSNVPMVWERLSSGCRVIDFPDDKVGDAINLLKRHYFCSHKICAASALYLDSHIIKDYHKFILDVASSRNSFCVLEEGTGKIIGVAFADINSAIEEEVAPNKCLLTKDVFNAMKFERALLHKANIEKNYKVGEYFCIHVVCVEPDFNGNGVGTSLVQACLSRAQKLNLSVCIGIFPAGPSQTIACRLEFDLLAEMEWISVKMSITSAENDNHSHLDHTALESSLVSCMGILLPLAEEQIPRITDFENGENASPKVSIPVSAPESPSPNSKVKSQKNQKKS